MLHELWDDRANDGSYTFCLAGPHGDGARALLSDDAERIWTIEAASHFEAMSAYYEYQGWRVDTTDQEWDTTTYAEQGWE